jgi:ABC-type transport system substrate-binding protein
VGVLCALAVAACGGGKKGDDNASSNTTANEQVIEPAGEVTPGGKLIFGLEAETDGWDPTINRWAVSGHQVAQTIFDQLATFNADGEAVPYLADSFESNDDYTQWTITLRDGIKFHDGTDLTGDAVKETLERHMASPLTAPAVRPIESVETDPSNPLVATVNLSSPWAAFPVVLASQIGYIVAPSQFAAGEDGRRNPVGTGPFVFDDWVPDNHLTVTKNPDYWRQDADGNPLPYLNEVEFQPIIESQQRVSSLEAGDISMFHTTDPDAILDVRELADSGQAQIKEDGAVGEETFILLNTQNPPLDNPDVRRALALATDRDSYATVVDKGIRPVAASPFIESSPWYSQEAVDEYPSFDMDAAKALVTEIEAENGPISFTLGLTPSSANREATQFLGELWGQAGMDVTFKETEQAQFIGDALAGNYQANLWRQFGATDPDGEYVWWDIKNADPDAGLALNFSRIQDQALTDAMDAGREGTTFDERKTAYDEAQMRINQDIPFLWLDHTLWAIAADNTVRNIGVTTLPNGDEGFGFAVGFAGAISLTEVWMES